VRNRSDDHFRGIGIGQNTAALQVVYDHPEYTDWSTITWYRGSTPGDKAIQVAVTALNSPYRKVRSRTCPSPWV
jgi:hypothetical protein